MLHRRCLLAACLLFLVSGCSAESGVSGTITQKGSPVASGTIRFVPAEGKDFSAPIYAGKYTVTRASIAGEYKVFVKVNFANATGAEDYYANLETAGPAGLAGPAEPPRPGESGHGDDEQSKTYEFSATLNSGANSLDHDIRDE